MMSRISTIGQSCHVAGIRIFYRRSCERTVNERCGAAGEQTPHRLRC